MDEAAGMAAWHSSRGDNHRSRRAVTESRAAPYLQLEEGEDA